MARIQGVDLPRNKRLDIALTAIYGIGRKKAKDLLRDAFGDDAEIIGAKRTHQLIQYSKHSMLAENKL